jgi:rod shape-determining protein MreB
MSLSGTWRRFFGRWARDMGVDLGTANTLIHVRGKGILLREPSVVAVEQSSRRILAIGEEAKRMLGRTPENIVAIRPLKDGVIADFDITEHMLKYFITKVHRRRALVHPSVLIGIPSGVTEVERRAVKDATLRAGAREALLMSEPMAAAIGAGLPVAEPAGSMVVDIGGGTSEVAVVSLGSIVTSRSIRIAGDEIDESIIAYMRRAHNLLVGERTAEHVKILIGCAWPETEERQCEVRGRDLMTGLPRGVTVTSGELRQAIQEPVAGIAEAVRLTLEQTPPELAADIMDRGIVLTGGGALLRGLDRLIAHETGMPVHVVDDPLTCVVMGTGIVLEHLEVMREALDGSGPS